MTEHPTQPGSPPPNAASAPNIFSGRFEVLGTLGEGGMGRVYRVRDRETNEMLALKLLLPEYATNPAMAERFKNELRLARRITHKNVCRIYDFNRTDSSAYITMEYVDGETLRSLIKRGGPLPPARLVEIATQICAGLAEAHAQGVVHRDLKPENIMITTSGQVKLMDFGIARSLDNVNTSHTMIGTPGYMAPEQAQGKPVTARTDIYAFGMIMYECLTGQPAFTGPTPVAIALKQMQERPTPPRALRPDVPPPLDAGIMRCLEKDPARRFASAEALAAALTPATATTSPSVKKPVAVTPPRQPKPSRIPWALVLVVMGVGAIWMVKHRTPTASEPQEAASVSTPIQATTPDPPIASAPFPESRRFGSSTPNRLDDNNPGDNFGDSTSEFDRTKAAAESGDAHAQMRLSQIFQNGPEETRDAYQAREWMRRAAEQGVPEAQFALAIMYERGVGGPPDRRTALSWIERAAQGGHEGAQRMLARMQEQRQQPGQYQQQSGPYQRQRGQYQQQPQSRPTARWQR